VHKSYPCAEISWLVRTEFTGLLEGHPYLNRIILFNRKFLGTAWKNPRAFGGVVSLIKRLRKEKFDLIIDLQGLFRTASLGWLSGCKARIGPGSKREFSHLFYTNTASQDKNCIHVVDYYLKLASAAGAATDKAEFLFPKNAKADESIKSLLADIGVGQKEYAVLIPGSAHPEKRWPIERFAIIADKINDRFGFSMVATGGVGEKRLVEAINDKAKVNVKNLAGKTNVSFLISLLRNARLVISNDTGPGHIAAALKVPLVMIFGRSNPARFAPYHRPQCAAAIEPDIRGDSINNFEEKYDIKHITVDDVFEKACTQLK
jgi:ADP-heptose:LPS heptosyltransferase